MTMKRRTVLAGLGATAVAVGTGFPSILQAQAQTITLNGAVQFNDDHAFTKALVKFEELTKQYYGKPINFILHKNSALGLEKQYFEYMAQGKAVDYGIVSPAHMSTFSKAAPFIDAPFLFRDLAHWNKVLDADVLKPVADEIAQKADVMLIGYAGGGIRNIFINKPMGSLAEIKGLKVRVQGAPIWSKTFAGRGHVADRHRLQRGLQRHPERRHPGRRERGGGRRVDEVLRGGAPPRHDRSTPSPSGRSASPARPSRACRPTCRPPCSRPARRPAPTAARSKSGEDEQKLEAMEKAGKLKRVPFKDRAEMEKLVAPVMAAYAKEIGADEIYAKIAAIK